MIMKQSLLEVTATFIVFSVTCFCVVSYLSGWAELSYHRINVYGMIFMNHVHNLWVIMRESKRGQTPICSQFYV